MFWCLNSIEPRLRPVSSCSAGRSMMSSARGAAGALLRSGISPAISSVTRRSSSTTSSVPPTRSPSARLTKTAFGFASPPAHSSRTGSSAASSSRRFCRPIKSTPTSRKLSPLPSSAAASRRGRAAVVSTTGMRCTGRAPSSARSSGSSVSGRLPAGAERTKSVSREITSVNRSKLASTARFASRIEK